MAEEKRLRVDILGVQFDNFSMGELLAKVESEVEGQRSLIVALSNPEFVVRATEDSFLRRYLNEVCAVNVADGIGVVLASKVLGVPLKERVTGTDFLPALVGLAADRGYTLFFLGGRPGVAERAREFFQNTVGDGVVVGCRNGFFGMGEEDDIVAQINNTAADIVMVCLGSPKQEEWICRNQHRLKSKLVFGNGGALDYYSGEVNRAPVVVQKLGFEWLYRLGQDFSLARVKRQLRLGTFVRLVVGEKVRRGLGQIRPRKIGNEEKW